MNLLLFEWHDQYWSFLSKLTKNIQKVVQKYWYLYYIRYIVIENINDYENIGSVSPFFLIIGEVDGHIGEKNGSKYLIFDSTDKNRKVLKKYTEL